MNDVGWTAIAAALGMTCLKWIEVTLDRRREDRKERDKQALPKQIFDADRLDTVQEKYDKLRKDKDDQDDAFDTQERELKQVLKLYDRAITAVQWLVLDNQLMRRELRKPPDPRYLHLTNNDIAVPQNDMMAMLEDKQREIDRYEQILRKLVDGTEGVNPRG